MPEAARTCDFSTRGSTPVFRPQRGTISASRSSNALLLQHDATTSELPLTGPRPFRLFELLFGLAILLVVASPVVAADMEETRKLLISGKYDACIEVAGKAIDDRVFGEEWYAFKAEAEMQTGRYQDAFETISAGLTRYAWSIRLRQGGIDPA